MFDFYIYNKKLNKIIKGNNNYSHTWYSYFEGTSPDGKNIYEVWFMNENKDGLTDVL